MAGYTVVNIPSAPDGCVDVEALRAAAGPDTAGLMLTNPNTLGIFEKHILEITKIVHDAGGLCYYDGANLNAVMGIVRPGDMGFDVVHLNLHKTFSTPHGGGGPGAGAVGCKDFLRPFLPGPVVEKGEDGYHFVMPEHSIGRVKDFYGNFTVVVKALTYLLTLGKEGVPRGGGERRPQRQLHDAPPAGEVRHGLRRAVHARVRHGSLEAQGGDRRLRHGHRQGPLGPRHPSPDHVLPPHRPRGPHGGAHGDGEPGDHRRGLRRVPALWDLAHTDPQALHDAPKTTPVGRLDEVGAARNPVLRYEKAPQ